MKNILLPTDFSENSWNAIKYALEFYQKTTCNFYLLHVTLISNYTGSASPLIPPSDSLEKLYLKQTKDQLKKLLKEIKKLPVNTKHHFFPLSTFNYFTEAVKDHIEEKNIELIIMGTKGASGLTEIIIGSNTGDLITKVKCPVLMVPENSKYKEPKEIAFPTDYNIFYQPKILNTISEFAKMYDSSVRILHIAKKRETLNNSQIENKEFFKKLFYG